LVALEVLYFGGGVCFNSSCKGYHSITTNNGWRGRLNVLGVITCTIPNYFVTHFKVRINLFKVVTNRKQPTNLEISCFTIPHFNFNNVVGLFSLVGGLWLLWCSWICFQDMCNFYPFLVIGYHICVKRTHAHNWALHQWEKASLFWVAKPFKPRNMLCFSCAMSDIPLLTSWNLM
jgi:hypothetical protein